VRAGENLITIAPFKGKGKGFEREGHIGIGGEEMEIREVGRNKGGKGNKIKETEE
jgi:hypothetical protein